MRMNCGEIYDIQILKLNMQKCPYWVTGYVISISRVPLCGIPPGNAEILNRRLCKQFKDVVQCAF
jgi:hypothetical protein